MIFTLTLVTFSQCPVWCSSNGFTWPKFFNLKNDSFKIYLCKEDPKHVKALNPQTWMKPYVLFIILEHQMIPGWFDIRFYIVHQTLQATHIVYICVFVCVCAQSFLTLSTLWTIAFQASLPKEFPGKNTGVGSHFLLQVIFNPGIKPMSLAFPALAGGFFASGSPGKPYLYFNWQ